MAKRIYESDAVMAAVCLWEEIVESAHNPDATQPWEPFRQDHGTFELREVVINHLAEACDRAWSQAHALYEQACRAWETRRLDAEVRGAVFLEEEPTEPGVFDWEFIPAWIRVAVDWEHESGWPTVIGE